MRHGPALIRSLATVNQLPKVTRLRAMTDDDEYGEPSHEDEKEWITPNSQDQDNHDTALDETQQSSASSQQEGSDTATTIQPESSTDSSSREQPEQPLISSDDKDDDDNGDSNNILSSSPGAQQDQPVQSTSATPLTTPQSSEKQQQQQTLAEQQQAQKPTPIEPRPVPGEIYLHQVPDGLFLEYRRPSRPTAAALWLAAMGVSALATGWQRLLHAISTSSITSTGLLTPIVKAARAMAKETTTTTSWIKLTAWFVVKAVVVALSVQTLWQDISQKLAPSRVTIGQLARDYNCLPSAFSRYEGVSVPEIHHNNKDDNETTLWNVHYLECAADNMDRNNKNTNNNSGIIYLNHGFGASSLSWLPAMKPLVNQLQGYDVALSHDAPGFGFTDRQSAAAKHNAPSLLEPFTSRGSAAIGQALWRQKTRPIDDKDTMEKTLLMGHSMGAVTTLRMALSLPREVPKQIVLVAPALGIRPNGDQTAPRSDQRRRLPQIRNFLTNRVSDPLASYVLRRAVGRPGFWRSGLRFAWGDPNRVRASDVLRFQWPALGKGWEKGLLLFSRAQLLPMEVSDADLLQQVLNLPNTTVHVIYGSQDPVVKPSLIQTFFEPHSDKVKLVELPGLGHDPFEEDVDAFVVAVQRVLDD